MLALKGVTRHFNDVAALLSRRRNPFFSTPRWSRLDRL